MREGEWLQTCVELQGRVCAEPTAIRAAISSGERAACLSCDALRVRCGAMLESEGAVAVAVAVFGKREERLHDAKVEVEFFLWKAGPHRLFWLGAKRRYVPAGWAQAVTCHCWSAIFSLNVLPSDDLVSLLVFLFLLFFFTLNMSTVNQAVLNSPLAIVHIYVQEKNGFSCPPSSHARRCSHSLLQRARRAFRHLQPRSSNGISAILSERGTALLDWQSSGRGGS